MHVTFVECTWNVGPRKGGGPHPGVGGEWVNELLVNIQQNAGPAIVVVGPKRRV